MVAALTESGRSALGVDLSATAVETSRRRGALALRRDVTGPLPGEGRWGTVLLMDSNLGLGGDADMLLRRCRSLVAAGGLIICEADPEPAVDQTHRVLLTSGTVTGSVAQTRWGPVQVQLTVANGKITHVSVIQYPNGNGRDQEINARALPILIQETLKAQGDSIDMVSGATVTSDGYLQSLQSALDKAGL